MRKKLVILLIFIAVIVYGYNIWLIVRGVYGGGSSVPVETGNKPVKEHIELPGMRVVHFEEKGKSPFTAYKEAPKPVVVNKPVQPKIVRQSTEAKPPRIQITGIMWNPSNPMAMVTLPDGSSAVAKAGQSLAGGIEVKKVEKERIQIVYEGNVFWIKK